MDFWQFLIAVIAIETFYRLIKLSAKIRIEAQQLKYQNADSEERLAKLEQRIQNLETIVIEHAKKSEFERL